MLKITKGLKKKKKGKKSKHKEEELFDSAELEQYRRDQQQKQEAASEAPDAADSEKGEEWEKFKALTSGVDDILKKTQGDLDRIKSTSFFQKKPPGPSSSNAEPTKETKQEAHKGKWVGFEEGSNEEGPAEVGEAKVEEKDFNGKQEPDKVEEEEEEEESEFDDDQDDIFDTSYVDVVASGEVKLAYVPDSPDKVEDDGFDPFDTSIVEKVIKTDPRKKNLVSLGCAVEVLTGKLEKAAGAQEAVKPPRRRPRTQDLLLDSFEEGELEVKLDGEPEPPSKSILDDDPVFAEETSAILVVSPPVRSVENKPVSTPKPAAAKTNKGGGVNLKSLVDEFVAPVVEPVGAKVLGSPDDELDDEFAALAAESLAKSQQESTKPSKPQRPEQPNLIPNVIPADPQEEFDEFQPEGDDPFDTTFASQVLPGKFELKLIEKEILENPRIEAPPLNLGEQKLQEIIKKVENNTVKADPFEDGLSEQQTLKLEHRDLLGGSTTDLSKISQSPIAPKSVSDTIQDFAVEDPFDTSIIDKIVAPGKTELKFLEKELLAQANLAARVEVDNDFDPRAEEKTNRPLNRPDNLEVSSKRTSVAKIVAFDLKPVPELTDLLAVGQEESSKVSKPLTPYYPGPDVPPETLDFDTADPFDTSFVTNLPGKLELKLIEEELSSTKGEIKRRLSDPDFDPRAEEITEEQNPTSLLANSLEPEDIISGEVEIQGKLHTPVIPKKITEVFEESEDFDPFDTSIANVLVPGKAEIKILETELIYAKENSPVNASTSVISEALAKKLSQPRLSVTDVLEQPAEDITVKPLTPVPVSSLDEEDVDPFDTSRIGENLPGKTEIKILESELLN